MTNIRPVMVCVVLICTFSLTVSAAEPLSIADWSVKSPHSLAAKPSPAHTLLAFINKLTDSEYSNVCYSRFADLRRSGNLSLVVSASDGWFCYVSIIDKVSSGFEIYYPPAHSGIEGIEDLRGNGQLELILGEAFSSYYGVQHCEASWPVIYAWTGTGYSDVSSEYKPYYKRHLALLKKQIDDISAASEHPQSGALATAPRRETGAPLERGETVSIQQTRGSSMGVSAGRVGKAPEASSTSAPVPAPTLDARSLDCVRAEAAKIERFLGISSDAGMSDAISWANSDKPVERHFAASILADIGTPDAIEYLKTLAHDSDRTVAGSAKIYLNAGPHQPGSTTMEREEAHTPSN